MTTASQPLCHPLDRPLQLLARGPSLHGGSSFPVRFPAKLKSQEVKSPVVEPTIAAKTNLLRLLRGHFQPVLCQPLLQCLLECCCFVPIFEARHKIVRKAEQSALASICLLHLLLEPEV